MHQKSELTSGYISKLQSLNCERNVTSIMKGSWSAMEPPNWRNLLSYCLNIYGEPCVDKALEDAGMNLMCPLLPGISDYRINTEEVEDGKCHKSCAGEILGSVRT
jgi:hypothetical protein